MKDKTLKIITIAVFLISAAAFVINFAKPAILRAYIENSLGNCQKIPVLCLNPSTEITNPEINKDYILELLPYSLEEMEIRLPKGFTVIKERMKKVYYKKNRRRDNGSIVYLLYENPDFFINLFPQLKNQGINDDYEFLRRTMYTQLKDVNNLTDVFFVIMKSVFIPDLGSQNNINMLTFTMAGRKGFINYSIGKSGNYFDCNIISSQKDFFKVYIKDKSANLSLEKVLAIISTIGKAS